MSDFKAKMHNSISAGAPQQTPLWELTALQSLDLIAVFKGRTSKGGSVAEWLVYVLDSGAEGPGFKSQSRRCRVTVLGKLFTPIV